MTTDEGRDDRFYCHFQILAQKSQFFAERLSKACPALDSRCCVEVQCSEAEVNSHVSALRLLYASELGTWHGVKNTLGILQAADRLGCREMARACMEYLEAVPWDEAEEEEILRWVPGLGTGYSQILSRLQPVDPAMVSNLFVSAVSFTTSPQPAAMDELKQSAQEQLEYMLTEDDDSPVVVADDGLVKARVKESVGGLLAQLDAVLAMNSQSIEARALRSLLSDVSWACQILSKMEMMRDLVCFWAERSVGIAAAIEGLPPGSGKLEAMLKAAEVVLKVLEAIGYGSVILPAVGRLCVVRAWLPFVQRTRPLAELDGGADGGEGAVAVKVDCEMWQSLESAFVSTLLTLPSGDLAGILTSWLRAEQVQYPDLTEAFEVWCYRSKAARRRFGLAGSSSTAPR